MPGGQPKAEPVWIDLEDDLLLVATDEGSLKAKNTLADPRVALSVVAADDPYEQVLVRGRVVERRADGDLEVLDRLSERYLGQPFPRRKWGTRVVLVIEPHIVRWYRSGLSELRKQG